MNTMNRRRALLALSALGLLGCADVNGGQQGNRGSLMNMNQTSLWTLIATLEQQMPLTIAKVEAVIGGKFALTKESPAYTFLEAKGPTLSEGLSVAQARLMLRPSLQFEDNSALSLELDAGCIPLTQVRERFGDLTLLQAPRGRSLDETTAWTAKRPWGHLSFAFQERQPDCLFRVTFHKQLP